MEEATGCGGSDGGEPPKMGKTMVRGQLAATGLMKREEDGRRASLEPLMPSGQSMRLGGGGDDVNRALALLSGGNIRESRERG